ncbi:MAG: hypothetical protein KJ574_04910, partial [Nanoarchaeota archaeon]|nr:hypothetical protein [Nanoarchaeota archaeon]
TVNVTGLLPMVKRIIASLYKAGFEEIEVIYSDAKEFEKIQEVLSQTCMGFEIISKKDNHVMIKSISTIDPEQYNILLRRSWLTLLEMGEELENGYKNQDINLYDSVILSDLTLNRFTDFCRRTINIGSYVTKRPMPEYVIVETVEKMGDIYKDIANLMKNKKIKYETSLASSLKEVNGLLREFYELFYQFDYNKLTEFTVEQWKFSQKCQALCDKFNKQEIELLMMLKQIGDSLFGLNGVLIARGAKSD